MSSKITLITPPDIYENSNFSVLFLGMTTEDQEKTSNWLASQPSYPDVNFYYYQGENNPSWLLYAANRADAKFLNLDCEHAIINIMASYIASRPNVYYMTKNESLASLISHVNNNRVSSIEQFLERAFDVK
jgi:hypothetical protein